MLQKSIESLFYADSEITSSYSEYIRLIVHLDQRIIEYWFPSNMTPLTKSGRIYFTYLKVITVHLQRQFCWPAFIFCFQARWWKWTWAVCSCARLQPVSWLPASTSWASVHSTGCKVQSKDYVGDIIDESLPNKSIYVPFKVLPIFSPIFCLDIWWCNGPTNGNLSSESFFLCVISKSCKKCFGNRALM